MLIAQISDLHLRSDGALLNGLVDTQQALADCIAHIETLDPMPDVVLASGDLANDGLAEDYTVLRQAFDTLPMPVYVIPGNHDDRARLRDAFADQGYLPRSGEFLHYVVDDYAMRLIGLDTITPGEVGGRMCTARLQWLSDRLDEHPERPTIVFMHHPPFATGIGFMDSPPFAGASQMEAVVGRHPQVRLVTCGHVHRSIQTSWAGVPAAIAPSIVFQMSLELAEGAPSAFVLEPPALCLFLCRGENSIIGATSLIGDFGSTHRFHPEPV